MADKIYPSKPSGVPSAGNPSFPATKAQLYNNSRPVYRPQPRPTRRRSRCCSCCLWITVVFLTLITIAAVAGGVFYLIYRPHRPTFSVSAVHLSQFNFTSSDKHDTLTARFNFTITARNPNKKITFYYDPITVTFNSNELNVGDGTIPAFVTKSKNTTSLRTVVSTIGRNVDDKTGLISKLRSDLKSKRSLPLKIQLDTKVKAKIGKLKTKRLPIRVRCDGITAVVPAGNTATTAVTEKAKCKVDVRIKIWKWRV